jgi:ferric-dicitrate binding protein FerR (iron transport regulator)
MMNQEEISRLISVFLAGVATDEEGQRLREWIIRSPENKRYFQQARNIWETSQGGVAFADFSTEKALAKVLRQITPPRRLSLWGYWQRVAAILLIPILLWKAFWFVQAFVQPEKCSGPYNEVYVSPGTRSSVVLPDGSKVWLNSGSVFRYPVWFAGNERTVFLKGEAFFEVQSDKKNPFIVQASGINVRATGTRFNVSAYTNTVEVTLVSGKVEVQKRVKGEKPKTISVLQPNQHYSIDTLAVNGKLANVDVYRFVSWKEGVLVFRNEALPDVVRKLEQTFNADIELQGEALQNYRYRATFRNESLEDILKMLKLTAPIDYRVIKREMLDDNTYSKQKIIIYSKTNSKTNRDLNKQ